MKVTCGNCHKEVQIPQCVPGAMLMCPECNQWTQVPTCTSPDKAGLDTDGGELMRLHAGGQVASTVLVTDKRHPQLEPASSTAASGAAKEDRPSSHVTAGSSGQRQGDNLTLPATRAGAVGATSSAKVGKKTRQVIITIGIAVILSMLGLMAFGTFLSYEAAASRRDQAARTEYEAANHLWYVDQIVDAVAKYKTISASRFDLR